MQYTADVLWLRGDQRFVDNKYSRRHTITFDCGVELPASSSPHVVRVPMSDPTAVDPEEAFVASLASCHLLTFLGMAAAKGYCVDRYADAAVGVMEPNADGRLWIARVTLRPEITFSGERRPTNDEFLALHHAAHDECFISNSVKTDVRVEPVELRELL